MSERADDEANKSGLPEITKKILSLGLGAYFLTEDAVRRAVKDAKLPRDLGKSVMQNASKGKEELFGFVARELSSFLRQMDVQKELDRFAQAHKIRVSAEIEFIPKPGAQVAPKKPSSSKSDERKFGKSDVGKIEPDDDLDDEPDDEELETRGRSPDIDFDVKFTDRRKPRDREPDAEDSSEE